LFKSVLFQILGDRFRQIFKFFRSIIATGLNRACLGEYFAKELKVKDSQRK